MQTCQSQRVIIADAGKTDMKPECSIRASINGTVAYLRDVIVTSHTFQKHLQI